MALDEDVLRDVEAARARLEELEDRAADARASFHQAIRRLHAAGGSMREIATALGMSHQRVHQIVGTEGIVEVEPSPAIDVTPHPAAPAGRPAEDACSFCASPRREADKLLAGAGPVFICSGCVVLAAAVVEGRRSTPRMRSVPVEDDATCSFCGNPSAIGGVMAEAPSGSPRICAGCCTTCQRLVVDEKPDRPILRRNARLRCSFCNISQNDTRHLVAGPSVYICEGCVVAATTVLEREAPAKGPRQVVLRPGGADLDPCSFCARTPPTAAIAKGGRGRICDECLTLCRHIIEEVG